MRPQAEPVWLPRLVIYNFRYHTRFIIAYKINTKYYDNVSNVGKKAIKYCDLFSVQLVKLLCRLDTNPDTGFNGIIR